MYLTRKHYVKNWNHTDDDQKHTVTVTGPAAKLIDPAKVSYIEEELMYWRKANAIHKFFINDREDNCSPLYVSHDQLKELFQKCVDIIANCPIVPGVVKNGQSLINGEWVHNTELGHILENAEFAAKTLPTTDGFFFGSTEYDQWYMEDIRATHKMLEELMANPDWEDATYYYEASW